MPQRGEGPSRPARETLAAIAEEMNCLEAPRGLVQPNHEGSRTANQVPKLDQSRACRKYNRIRRRLLQPIKTSRKWRVVSKRRDAHVAEGRAPPPLVAPPAPVPENGVDAAAAEAASKPPRPARPAE